MTLHRGFYKYKVVYHNEEPKYYTNVEDIIRDYDLKGPWQVYNASKGLYTGNRNPFWSFFKVERVRIPVEDIEQQED